MWGQLGGSECFKETEGTEEITDEEMGWGGGRGRMLSHSWHARRIVAG